jgi:SAM-dependent methyltransferase
MPNQEKLVEIWREEEQKPFQGWDFSYLADRMLEEHPPWSYMERAAALMQHASAVLDMGTGGGERLLKLKPHWPPKVVVTEEYIPNYKLATERLAPLGVAVKHIGLGEQRTMPFADEEFDLVLNRHSGLNPAEIARILAPGGTFLTQQVHGLWAQDLLAEFGAEPQWPWATPAYYIPKLEKAGLTLENAEEWCGEFTFTDVGAIVYYLKAVPWLVEGFSVETHLDALLKLQRRLEDGEPLTFEARSYLIEAKKV